ncbi:FIMAH domain-containing protein [Streptomyces endocoffeicus]|uniref:FIMAH domain-containing protein n=1 Tax=Streptomyces endocoffeicus TaxID=2898945 RepID=UPI003556C4DA
MAALRELVGRYDEVGEFRNHGAARALEGILAVVDGFEKRGELQKAVKGMKSFKGLLDLQKRHGVVSEKAYVDLASGADSLIERWQ